MLLMGQSDCNRLLFFKVFGEECFDSKSCGGAKHYLAMLNGVSLVKMARSMKF